MMVGISKLHFPERFPLIAETLSKLELKKFKKKEVEYKLRLFERLTRDVVLMYEILGKLDEKRILSREGRNLRYYKFKPFDVKLEQINKYGCLKGVIYAELPLLAI